MLSLLKKLHLISERNAARFCSRSNRSLHQCDSYLVLTEFFLCSKILKAVDKDKVLTEPVLKPVLVLQILKDQAGTDEDDDLSDGSHSHTVYTIARLVSNLNAEKKKNEKVNRILTLWILFPLSCLKFRYIR